MLVTDRPLARSLVDPGSHILVGIQAGRVNIGYELSARRIQPQPVFGHRSAERRVDVNDARDFAGKPQPAGFQLAEVVGLKCPCRAAGEEGAVVLIATRFRDDIYIDTAVRELSGL